jgi:hypothetical protein
MKMTTLMAVAAVKENRETIGGEGEVWWRGWWSSQW